MTSQRSLNMSPSSLSQFHLQKIWESDKYPLLNIVRMKEDDSNAVQKSPIVLY